MANVDTRQELVPRMAVLEIDRDREDVANTKAQEAHASPDRFIYFRNLDLSDIPQVRALHEEWFPIRYNQAFYDGAAQGLWMETGVPLFARLAVEMQPTLELHAPFHARLEDRRYEHIYGAVTASTLPRSKVDGLNLISPTDRKHTHIMYILTLGTQASVRRMGIASALLQECIAQACRQPQCGAIYLHVKADNLSARHFYEKNGFQNLRLLRDYYVIDGARYDAFLYIRYVNGAILQSGWFDLIARPLFALLSIASFGWKKLLDGFAFEEFEDTTEKIDHKDLAIADLFVNLHFFLPKFETTDLLDEVEDAMCSPIATKKDLAGDKQYLHDMKSIEIPSIVDTSQTSRTRSLEQSKNELDDLLDMFSDEGSKPATGYPDSLTVITHNTRTEFQAKCTKRCLQVLMDGGRANRGLCTAFSSRVCSNLRCNECDFTVMQFLNKKWDATADYMFFRDNTPNEAKLRVKMEVAPDFAAYACQCKWLSINLPTRVDQCKARDCNENVKE